MNGLLLPGVGPWENQEKFLSIKQTDMVVQYPDRYPDIHS